MNARLVRSVSVAAVFAIAVSTSAYGGGVCRELPLSDDAFINADHLANRLKHTLDGKAKSAAIVARAGADLSRYGLRYSHAGLAVRSAPNAPWRVVHMLNHCGRPKSKLFEHGLLNFFLDDPFEYAALALIPSPELQERLLSVARDGTIKALFDARYNMLAHPSSLTEQNSNQWLIELIAAAQSRHRPIRTRKAAQEWLAAHGDAGDVIKISALTRLAARMFKANISFSSQNFSERMAGRIATTTVRSISNYLEKSEPNLMRIELVLDSPRATRAASRQVARDRDVDSAKER